MYDTAGLWYIEELDSRSLNSLMSKPYKQEEFTGEQPVSYVHLYFVSFIFVDTD